MLLFFQLSVRTNVEQKIIKTLLDIFLQKVINFPIEFMRQVFNFFGTKPHPLSSKSYHDYSTYIHNLLGDKYFQSLCYCCVIFVAIFCRVKLQRSEIVLNRYDFQFSFVEVSELRHVTLLFLLLLLLLFCSGGFCVAICMSRHRLSNCLLCCSAT